jgi:ankyrin repeat protein
MYPVEINVQENLTSRNDDQNVLMDRFLYEYVKEDNIVTFKSCVQKHSPDKLVTPSGNSLLHVAVSYGSDKIAAYLAEEFPSLITSRNDQEDTILHVAAREGRLSNTIKTLVGSNPSLVRLENRKGNIPLHDAVIRGNKEAVAWLVCKDPGAAFYNNNTQKSPLYLAVESGHKNGILDDLLNIEASSGALQKGKSPVHAAIEQRNKGEHNVYLYSLENDLHKKQFLQIYHRYVHWKLILLIFRYIGKNWKGKTRAIRFQRRRVGKFPPLCIIHGLSGWSSLPTTEVS